MSTSKQARYRQRKSNGRAIFSIEADVVAVEHLLEQAKLLPQGADHGHC